jgi:hypothetical protein
MTPRASATSFTPILITSTPVTAVIPSIRSSSGFCGTARYAALYGPAVHRKKNANMNDPDIGGVRQMMPAVHRIAEFAVGLKYEQIPGEVLEHAKAERLFSQLAEAEKDGDFSQLDFAL